MAIVDLRPILSSPREGIPLGETICPIMTHLGISQSSLDPSPKLASMITLCVKEKCGMYSLCSGKKSDA